MDNRERSAKKRKREVKNGPGIDHKSPFEPFRSTEGVGKSRGQHKHKSKNGPKSPKLNSKGRGVPVNREFVESRENEVTDDSDAGVVDGVIPPTAQDFSDLDIAPGIQKEIVSMGFSKLKEIQRSLIPSILAGKDASSPPPPALNITNPNLLTP